MAHTASGLEVMVSDPQSMRDGEGDEVISDVTHVEFNMRVVTLVMAAALAAMSPSPVPYVGPMVSGGEAAISGERGQRPLGQSAERE